MSLIECLANQECADKLRIAQGRYTVEDVVRYDHKLDTWTVYASSGEHQVEGENLGHAYLRFTESHPDDFVQAIVSSEMKIEGYTAEFKNEHSALCRSRITGESEDRCNCVDTEVLEEEANAHAADYPGTYKPSCSRCGCPCGNSDTCGCNDDTGYKSFSDPNVRGD